MRSNTGKLILIKSTSKSKWFRQRHEFSSNIVCIRRLAQYLYKKTNHELMGVFGNQSKTTQTNPLYNFNASNITIMTK